MWLKVFELGSHLVRMYVLEQDFMSKSIKDYVKRRLQFHVNHGILQNTYSIGRLEVR